MKNCKRIITGLAYSTPLFGLVSYLVYLLNVDPQMVEVIKITGYFTFGIFVLAIILVSLLAIFSLSLLALKHLFNLDRTPNEVPVSPSDKIE